MELATRTAEEAAWEGLVERESALEDERDRLTARLFEIEKELDQVCSQKDTLLEAMSNDW